MSDDWITISRENATDSLDFFGFSDNASFHLRKPTILMYPLKTYSYPAKHL